MSSLCPHIIFFFLAWFFLEFKLVYICDILSAYTKLLSKILRERCHFGGKKMEF